MSVSRRRARNPGRGLPFACAGLGAAAAITWDRNTGGRRCRHHRERDIARGSSMWRRGGSAARFSSATRSTRRSRSGSSPAPGCLSGMRARSPTRAISLSRAWARRSVILCRDRAGEVHVFLNSCRHRGMKVCRYDEGNTPVFTCPYHGWSYGTDGRLVGRPLFPRGLPFQARPLAMGTGRGGAAVPLQGDGVGHLGPGGPALSRIFGRLCPLSRPDPRRQGRARGPGRGAGRRAEMADPVQLEVPGREFQRRQLPQHQPPLGRPGRDRPLGRRPPRHGRADARPQIACRDPRPRPPDDRLCPAEGPAAARCLSAFPGRLRILSALRGGAPAHPRRGGPADGRAGRNLPQCGAAAAPAALARRVASARRPPDRGVALVLCRPRGAGRGQELPARLLHPLLRARPG